MGDVFSGGNQNIVATIDSKKISTQEFMKYVNRLNLDDKKREQLTNGDLLEKILSSYIGKKVLSLELQNQNVSISDKSLKDIITNDKAFYKDDRFQELNMRISYIKQFVGSTFGKTLLSKEKEATFEFFI